MDVINKGHNPPLVSICIPTYNSAKTLIETLNSIILQSYQNLEILIVDNASSDNTIKLAQGYFDPRVKIHAFTENIGAEGNFNRCINLATGEYTAIYHADDVYRKDIVAKQIEYLERNIDIGVVFTEADVIDANGSHIGSIHFPKKIRKLSSEKKNFILFFKSLLEYSNFIICPSAMVRTYIYKYEVKEWRGKLFGSSADLDVWLRIAQKYSIGLMPEKLMDYRISSHQHSHLVRYQTERADFFRVIDYYLTDSSVVQMLTEYDFEKYQTLMSRDLAMRAANYFLKGEFRESSALIRQAMTYKNSIRCFKSKKGFLTFCLLAYLELTNRPGIRNTSQKILIFLKNFFRK